VFVVIISRNRNSCSWHIGPILTEVNAVTYWNGGVLTGPLSHKSALNSW